MALVKAMHRVYGEVVVPDSKVALFPNDYELVTDEPVIPDAEPVEPVDEDE